MRTPWLLVHAAILVDRRRSGFSERQSSRFVSCVASAAEIVRAGYDGHSWLAEAPGRASWKGGRALDTAVQIGEFDDVGVQFKPRGQLVYEVQIPLEVAERLFAEAEENAVQFLVELLRKCLADAGRRWNIGMPREVGGSSAADSRLGLAAVRSASESAGAPKLIVEIHVPLDSGPESNSSGRQSTWIDDVEDFLAQLDEEADGAEAWDDGEEWFGNYVFFIAGQDEARLLEVASRAATLERVPAGAFAVVTDEEVGEVWGSGDRIPLPVPAGSA